MYGVPGSGVFSSNGSSQIVPPMPLEQPRNLYRFGEQTIWSAQFLAAGAIANNTFRLFATPQGQNGQGFVPMSIAETNLKEGGRVPSGVAYDVFGIACAITAGTTNPGVVIPIDSDATIGDLLNIQTNGVLTWDFTQTQVDIAPIVLVGAGGGVFGAVAAATTVAATNTQVGHMNNGAGSVWMYRKYPVALPGNSTFSILLRFGAQAPVISASASTVKIILLGYYKNIVELG